MFIAHFAEEVNLLDNVEDFYVVYHDGHKVTSASWPKIAKLAETSKVRVHIKRYVLRFTICLIQYAKLC